MRKFLLAAIAALAIATPALAQAIKLNWTVNHTPAVSTQATASKAADANYLHVATSCSGSISTVAAQTNITLSLRDGASGAGTVLWSETTTCLINTSCVLTSPPEIYAVGTVGTAMTCEWSGAPVTNNFAVVTLVGFDVHK